MSTCADAPTPSNPLDKTKSQMIRASLVMPLFPTHLKVNPPQQRLLRKERRERGKGNRLLDRPQGRLIQKDTPRRGQDLDIADQARAYHGETNRHPLYLTGREARGRLNPATADLLLDRYQIVAERRIRVIGGDAALCDNPPESPSPPAGRRGRPH